MEKLKEIAIFFTLMLLIIIKNGIKLDWEYVLSSLNSFKSVKE